VIKPKRKRWTGNLAHVGQRGNMMEFWPENLKGNDHLENVGVEGRIRFDRILEKWGGNLWTRFIWSRKGPV